MDSTLTMKLTEQWLDHDHSKVVESLNENHDLAFKYLSNLLAEKEPEIEKEYNSLMMSGGRLSSRLYNEYKHLMLKFVKVLSERKYRNKLAEYVKKKYYPADDCL